MTERCVHLVRHGQSTWNAQSRLQGQTVDVPLTDLGIAESHSAAQLLARIVSGPIGLWSSDQLRARETAEVIADRLGLVTSFDADLRELSYGDAEGFLLSEVPAVEEGVNPLDLAYPGGETLRDLYARVADFFARTLASNTGGLIVVSHGETLRTAIAYLSDEPVERLPRDVPANGSVLTMRVG